MNKRVEGVSRFAVENCLSHSAEKFRRGIPYCCINFGYRKSLDKRGGGYQDFPSKIICLTVSKTFAGEPFRVSESLLTEKLYELEGVGVSIFSVENFLSQSAEKFRRGTI